MVGLSCRTLSIYPNQVSYYNVIHSSQTPDRRTDVLMTGGVLGRRYNSVIVYEEEDAP